MLAIAEEGTVTRAALRLHLSQSGLSHRLHGLEQRIGTELFRRQARRMTLTAAGEVIVRGARRLCLEFREFEETVGSLIHGAKPILRLGTECYTSYHWLPALMGGMAGDMSDVDIRIVIEATQRAKAALEAGEVDAAILQSSGVDPRVEYWPLFRDELQLVIGPSHRLAGRKYVQPADLGAETLLLHHVPSGKYAVVEEFFAPAKAYPRQLRQVLLTEAIVEMVRAGMGVSVLSRWLIEPHLRERKLTAIGLGPRGVWRHWRLAAVKGHALRVHIEQLAKALAASLKPRTTKPPRA